MVRRVAAVVVAGSMLAACSTLNHAPSVQLEANKALARRALSALERGDVAALNEIYEPNALVHASRGTQSEHGPYSDLASACPMCGVMDPRKIKLEVILAEGDLVTVRYTLSGTHAGTLRGVPASGKELTAAYTNIFRIREGRIAENWVAVNQLALFEQVGLTVCPAKVGE